MAGPVVAADRTELDRFLLAARHRLWAETVLGAVVPGLWGSAALLAATGIWHTLVTPLPLATSIGVGVLPLVIAIGRALISGKPGGAEAAAEADRRLAAGNLLATAFELTRLDDGCRPGAADIVLAQAAACVGAVGRLPGPTKPRPTAPRLVLPLAVACVGGLAHVAPLAPGPAVSTGTTEVSTSGAIRDVVEEVRDASTRPGVSNPADRTSSRDSPVDTETSFRASVPAGDDRTPEAAGTNPNLGAGPDTSSAPTADGVPGTGGMSGKRGGRDVAGDNRPNENAVAGTTAEAVMPTRTIDVRRPGATSAYGTGAGTFSEATSPFAAAPVASGPAAEAASLPVEGSAWTPALRAYTADYLSEIRHRR